ncbi:hypothetical protein BDY24DRAFT_379514 [Mrakia frigida]|uniref:uncharacterized protein n=1 Tax=Mrakia frigida TaxID=29902 RepID=UPI003FCC11CB
MLWFLSSEYLGWLCSLLSQADLGSVLPSVPVVTLAGRFFKVHKAKNVLIITLLHCLYYLATAISYTATRYKAPYNCPTGPLREISGCKGLLQALMAVNWIDFVLTLLYALTVYLLAKKHTTLPWTNRENGMNTDINNLCPIDDRTVDQKTRKEHV